MSYKEELILFLVKSGALKFGEFTTRSGRLSPYFLNAGNFNLGSHIETLGKLYSDCIMNTIKPEEFNIMFGPAYKGIPLAVSASCALYRNYGIDKSYCFNRKEIKDHGEGGIFVGASLKDGDKVIVIEDVVTAGTQLRETVPLLKKYADVEIKHMFILIDRMEKGVNGKTAPVEIKEELGIEVHSIVNTLDIIGYLHNKEIDGKVILTDEIKGRMEEYMKTYC